MKQTTIDGYMSKLKNHLIPLFGSYDMAKLSPTVVRKCLYALPPKTAKSCRRVLSAILKQAMYDNIIERNPLDSVKPPKTDKYEPAVLDIEDIEVYLWHFRDTKMEPVVLLAIGCGLRRGEIMAIEASDLSSDGILVDDEYVPTSKGVKHDTPKSRKQRKVVMPSKLLERLKEIAPESGPIVTNEAGERYHPDSISHLYAEELKTLPEDVPRVSLKNLRHSSLTLAYDESGDLLAVSRRAGHSSTTITARYYVRPQSDRDREVADMMDKKLSDATVFDDYFELETTF